MVRDRYPHAPVRWRDSQIEVFNLLAHHLHFNIIYYNGAAAGFLFDFSPPGKRHLDWRFIYLNILELRQYITVYVPIPSKSPISNPQSHVVSHLSVGGNIRLGFPKIYALHNHLEKHKKK